MNTEDNLFGFEENTEEATEEKRFKFNFAAFIMPQFWGIFNGLPIGLLAFIPFAFPFVAIYLGVEGTKLAYEKSYGTPERFFKKQKKWQIAGIIYFIGILALLVYGFKDELKNYCYNKEKMNQCLTEYEDNKNYIDDTLDRLTDESYLVQLREDINYNALYDTDFKIPTLEGRVLEKYSFFDLCKTKQGFVVPEIYHAYRYYELDDGKILRLNFKVENSKTISWVEYNILEAEEYSKDELNDTLRDGEVIESGMYMDSEILDAIFQSTLPENEICEMISTLDERIAEEQALAEAEAIEQAAAELYKPNEEGYYVLHSVDNAVSIEIRNPENYEVYDFTDADSFHCYNKDSQNIVTNFNAWIGTGDEATVEESMISEVELTCMLSTFTYQGITETEKIQIGDYEVSCFLFVYITAENEEYEELRIWSPIDENYCMCFSINKKVVDEVGLDFQECMELIFNNIRITQISE